MQAVSMFVCDMCNICNAVCSWLTSGQICFIKEFGPLQPAVAVVDANEKKQNNETRVQYVMCVKFTKSKEVLLASLSC